MNWLRNLIASCMPDVLGKGPGFIAFAIILSLQFSVLLAFFHVGGGTIAAAYGPLIVAVYGAGVWKAASDNKVNIANAPLKPPNGN